MDKLLYFSLLEEIEKSNFEKVIDRLQKVHSQDDKDYLYLRCHLEFMQKNFYASLDFLLLFLKKYPEEFKLDERFINLLKKVLNSLERFDLLDHFKNSEDTKSLLNKLVLWQGYKYE